MRYAHRIIASRRSETIERLQPMSDMIFFIALKFASLRLSDEFENSVDEYCERRKPGLRISN